MITKLTVSEAITATTELLKDVLEPERSLSFPIVLTHILDGTAPTMVKRPSEPKADATSTESFAGLTGGIRLLIQDGFFKEGRALGDIADELKRQGYHYPRTSFPVTLRGFLQKRILTRIAGENGQYRYVERK